MPLIMAMSMEDLEVTDGIGATILLADQMVNLQEVSVFAL
jgi:hypothetical protein